MPGVRHVCHVALINDHVHVVAGTRYKSNANIANRLTPILKMRDPNA